MDKFMSQIWKGEYPSERQSHMIQLQKQFEVNLNNEKNARSKLSASLKSSKTNLERIEIISQYYLWSEPSSSDLTKYQKSDALASKFRQLSNEFYRNRKFKQAIHGYNLAINFASTNIELALSFANRSAVFLETSQPFLAIKDIEKAESHDYPNDLLPKLLQRKQKCTKLLKNEESQLLGQNIINDEMFLTPDMKKRKKYCDDELFKLKNKSLEITSAENFVKIVDNPERGRHLVVTKDVKPGTVVIVEVPFAKILLKELRWDLEHCHYCHRPINFGIPCRECVFAYYCNETCRDSAFSQYHQYECKCLPFLHILKLPRTALLALRIIFKLGPTYLQEFYLRTKNSTMTDTEQIDTSSNILGFENELYDSASYTTIFNLISHPDKLEVNEIMSYCLTSLSVISILETQSTFFEQIDIAKEFKLFTASLILLHMENLPPNAHSLNELRIPEPEPEPTHLNSSNCIRDAQMEEYGAGAFALLSLINHSCNPNVFRINSFDKTSVITLRSLKCGEELVDNYGVHFAIDELDKRRQHLLTNYYFLCTCTACSNNWPLYRELNSKQETFLCVSCIKDKLLSFNENLQKYAVINNICSNCNHNYEITSLTKDFNMKIDKFFTAFDTVLNNDPLSSLSSLVDLLEYFDNSILQPFCRTNDTQETFKQALNLIVYFSTFRP